MTRRKPDTQIDDQGRAFIEKARELGCDEDPARFEETLRRIGRARPKREQRPKNQAAQREPDTKGPPR